MPASFDDRRIVVAMPASFDDLRTAARILTLRAALTYLG